MTPRALGPQGPPGGGERQWLGAYGQQLWWKCLFVICCRGSRNVALWTAGDSEFRINLDGETELWRDARCIRQPVTTHSRSQKLEIWHRIVSSCCPISGVNGMPKALARRDTASPLHGLCIHLDYLGDTPLVRMRHCLLRSTL